MTLVTASFVLLALLFEQHPASLPPPPQPQVDPFVGKWKLNLQKSALGIDPNISKEERTFGRDGIKVKVAWKMTISGKNVSGSYWAICDGSPQHAAGNEMSCWYPRNNVVDGEVHDPGDRDHVYFRREVALDGKTMTLTWFEDKPRTKTVSTRVYDRVGK